MIFSSGYSASVLRERSFLDDDARFLAKPYRLTHLVQSVRDTLNERSATAT